MRLSAAIVAMAVGASCYAPAPLLPACSTARRLLGSGGARQQQRTPQTMMAGFAPTPKAKKVKPKAAPPPADLTGLRKHDLGEGTQFMGGWVIEDPSITDDLIAEYKKTLKAGKALKGQVSMKGGQAPVVNKDVKDSMEFSFAPNDPNPAWKRYLGSLQKVMAAYVEEYPMASAYGVFGLTSRCNFQYYPPSGGYKTYHTERTGAGEPEGSRHLVFMTYMNDVTDEGGTEFYHQGKIIQPVKGLTLIWPADWTFTHRGVPSPSQEKMIVTGWFNYVGR